MHDSGKISGLQCHLRHKPPHSKYAYCCNHHLELLLVHLIKQFLGIAPVDKTALLVWKLFKHFFEILQYTQEVDHLTQLKMVKTAKNSSLSHRVVLQPIITRYNNVIDALNTIYQERRNPEINRLWDKLLRPHLILNMLFVADVLVPLNHCSCFLKFKSLVFADVSMKLKHLSLLCLNCRVMMVIILAHVAINS